MAVSMRNLVFVLFAFSVVCLVISPLVSAETTYYSGQSICTGSYYGVSSTDSLDPWCHDWHDCYPSGLVCGVDVPYGDWYYGLTGGEECGYWSGTPELIHCSAVTPTPTPSYGQCVKRCGIDVDTSCSNPFGLFYSTLGDGYNILTGCSDFTIGSYTAASLACPCTNPDPSLVNSTPTPTAVMTSVTSTPVIPGFTPGVFGYDPVPYNVPGRETQVVDGKVVWATPTVVSPNFFLNTSNQTIYAMVNWSTVPTLNATLPVWVNETTYRSNMCNNSSNIAAQIACPAINTLYNVMTYVNDMIFMVITITMSPITVFTQVYNYIFGVNNAILSGFLPQIGVFISVMIQVLNSLPPKVVNTGSLLLGFNLLELIITQVQAMGD